MRKSTQLRWIEQVETRSVQEHAALQRAVSEPDVNITYTTTGPIWSDWLRELARTLRRAVASARSSPVDKPIWDKARFHTAPKLPSTAIDYDRVLVAVLITDIVDSTKRVADMGDRDWRVLLDRHGDATRYQIKRFGGREVGNRGDGFVGIFDSPARAVHCAASALRRVARELGSRPKRFASAKAGSLFGVFVSCTPAIRASSVSKWRIARRFGSFALR